MLEEAEAILHQDLEEEMKVLHDSWFQPKVNYEKYKKAKALFEKVLAIEPDNGRAKEGMDICEEMLEPYIPVQHIAVPGDEGDLEAAVRFEEKKKSGDLKPWEFMRFKRGLDMEGVRYTSKVFGEESKKVKAQVKEIIEKALEAVVIDKMDPREVYDITSVQLEAFQAQVHQGWKGHGPEFLDEALRDLRNALELD